MRDLHLLREKAADVPVVLLLDAVEDEVMVVAMQAGAAGCLDRASSASHLFQALQDAAAGEIALSENFARRLARIFAAGGRDGTRQPYPEALTRRELQVLALLAHGLTNREIARSIFVSESTVRAHLRTVTQKLGVHNRVHAVARALELGMVSPAETSAEEMPSRRRTLALERRVAG
jgi:DNA-binding NarL/FixJ family response regulator